MAQPRVPTWRVLTWVILAFNVFMLVYVVTVAGSAGGECQKEELVGACQTGVALGVGVLILLWVAGDAILGVIWLVTRKPARLCPVCGKNVAVGVTRCGACGHDFRAAP